MRELPPSLKRLAFLVLGFLQLLQSPEIGVDSIMDAALAPPVSFIDVSVMDHLFIQKKLVFTICYVFCSRKHQVDTSLGRRVGQLNLLQFHMMLDLQRHCG